MFDINQINHFGTQKILNYIHCTGNPSNLCNQLYYNPIYVLLPLIFDFYLSLMLIFFSVLFAGINVFDFCSLLFIVQKTLN